MFDTPGDEDDVASPAAPAAAAAAESDLVLWCAPSGTAPDGIMSVRTKRDLTREPDAVCAFDAADVARVATRIAQAIKSASHAASTARIAMSLRQRGLVSTSVTLLDEAVSVAGGVPQGEGLDRPAETAALIRSALDALGAITGEIPPDDVLGLVFAGFCIGK